MPIPSLFVKPINAYLTEDYMKTGVDSANSPHEGREG